MSENIIQLNEEVVKGEIWDLVRKSVDGYTDHVRAEKI